MEEVDQLVETLNKYCLDTFTLPARPRTEQECELLTWFNLTMPVLLYRKSVISVEVQMNYSYVTYTVVLFKETRDYILRSMTSIMNSVY